MGGWGPRAPAGGKLGPLSRGAACSNSPTGTAPGHRCPHSGRPCSSHGAPALSWGPHRGGRAAGKAFVTFALKPDLGGPEEQLPGRQEGPPEPAAQAAHAGLRLDRPWFARPVGSAAGAGMLRGLGRVSGPLWAAMARPRQEVPTRQPRASRREGGQEAQGGGRYSPQSTANGSCEAGSSSASPGSSGISLSPTRCGERLPSLPSPPPPCLFSGPLATPPHAGGQGGVLAALWGRVCLGPVTDEETEAGGLLAALPGGLQGPRAASSAGLPHCTPDQPIPSRSPIFPGPSTIAPFLALPPPPSA